MKFKLMFASVFVAVLVSHSTTSAAGIREINASNILKGGPYYVLSENGVPNGMPCEWYAYAPTVGQEYCDHPGIDINANFENLYAATDGVIEFAGSDAAYWPMHVEIRVTSARYFGELHIYGHMSQVFVEPGQAVIKGELLGVSGTAGGAPHIHFERRTAPYAQCPIGCAIDPDPVLHGGQNVEAEPKSDEKKEKKAEPEKAKDESKKAKPERDKDDKNIDKPKKETGKKKKSEKSSTDDEKKSDKKEKKNKA